MSPSSNKLLSTCQIVSRSRPPFETKGRPHQSHSLDGRGFLPPQPGQIAMSSSSTVAGGDGMSPLFYTSRQRLSVIRRAVNGRQPSTTSIEPEVLRTCPGSVEVGRTPRRGGQTPRERATG